ncbi:S8 family peptidase [Coralloluteibacterium stylophorae]|nr:S8 family peptidase [Coralloluteibacterium stylophorae]
MSIHSAVRAGLLAAAVSSAFAYSAAQAADVDLTALTEQGRYDRFIVKFSDGTAEAAAPDRVAATLRGAAERAAPLLASRAGLRLDHMRRLSVGADLVRVDRRLDRAGAEALMRELAEVPGVEYVEVDQIMVPLLTPNDSRYSEQWGYFDNAAGISMPPAWDITNGSGTVVAVIDTGITSHGDLNANIIGGYDFISDSATARDGNGRDSNAADEGDWYGANECGAGYPAASSSWHGTHVAGTVAAVTNNGNGVAGVAYGAKVVPARVLGKCGGYTSDIVDAITWASGGSVSGVPSNPNPAEVINMSLGGGGSCSSSYQTAINGAVGRGTTVVVAAGNSNTNVSSAVPANCGNVVAVAATTSTGSRASFSNYGAGIDVSAPGQGILSTLNTGSTTPGSASYASYNGTSMAAPHVAGVVALMQAVAPTPLTPAQVESILKSTAKPLPGSCSGGCGAGIVDAHAAVLAASGGGGGDPEPPVGGTLANGTPVTGLSGSAGTELRFTMTVPAGASGLKFVQSGGSGDADLYVRFGSAPTTSSYDCRPYQSGNNETCTIATAQAGTYHVLVRGYSSFSGVSLTGSYTASSGGGGDVLQDGVPVTGISGASGSTRTWTVQVPAGTSSLSIAASGGSGDADLYVRRGSAPTTSAYDCRPYRTGNNETCTFSSPGSGTWYVTLRGYSTYSGVSLVANY